MGSVFEYLTIQDAAKHLNVSVRQVYRYINNGLLATVKTEGQHNKQLVSKKDLDLIAEDRATHRDSVKGVGIKRFRLMEAEVKILRQQVNALMKLNDMWDETETLNMSGGELAALHGRALELLNQTWSPADEAWWTELFVRIKMKDFDLMSPLVGDHPWRPFYALAQAMLSNPHDPEKNKLLLSNGLNNLERIASVWSTKISIIGTRKSERLKERDRKQVRKVLRKVERGRGKSED